VTFMTMPFRAEQAAAADAAGDPFAGGVRPCA
jgi:hypothetical protein